MKVKKASDKAKCKICYFCIKMYKKIIGILPNIYVCMSKEKGVKGHITNQATNIAASGLWGWRVWDRKLHRQFS